MTEILTLIQLRHEDETVIASIGGFDLVFEGQRHDRDGFEYSTMLMRTGTEQEIDLPVTVTPSGAVARLEHALAGFEAEQDGYRRRLGDAERRLASYRPRIDQTFAFAAELELKRAELAAIEADLALNAEEDGDCETDVGPAAAGTPPAPNRLAA